MDRTWPVYMEIDKKAIIYNMNKIKQYVGDNVDIMPIIKDCGYGTWLDEKIDILNECDIKIVGVAIVDEAVKLRRNGFKGELFVLNQIYREDILSVIKYNITLGVADIDFLKELGKYKEHIFKIHMEIDTGMGRTGIPASKVTEYVNEANKYNNVIIDGIYTHFSCSDCDEKFTKTQIAEFDNAVAVCKENNVELKYVHACNSAGIINFKQAQYNLVRPGIILYGYYPDEDSKKNLELKPAIKLKSKISFIKEVSENTPISYGKKYITDKPSRIATVQLGYADGLRRAMTNKGKVFVAGKVAPMVGTVCMDCFMIDITNVPQAKLGDEVYIWDNEHITLDEVAAICDTINYEVISTISNRVVRKYI